MDSKAQQQMADYIRANAQKYTREAIRARLLAAGHDPAQIDAAWELEMASAAGGLVALAKVLFVVGALLGAVGAFAALGASSYTGSVSAPLFLIGYAISYGAIGYGVVRLLRWAVPRYRIRGLWAGLLALVLLPAYGALMLGTCAGAFTFARGG